MGTKTLGCAPCRTSCHPQPQAPKIRDRNLLAQEVAVLRNQIQVKGVKKRKKKLKKMREKKKRKSKQSHTEQR